jgi:hypothetical protein
MAKVMTPAELSQKLSQLTAKAFPYVETGLTNAAQNVEGEAKNYCTPGKSPYYRAPYSDDNDPRREPPHMRDVMYTEVEVSDTRVRAVIGNPKHYALAVHEGTSRMQARPFILDAIKEKESETLELLSQAVTKGLKAQCV